MGNQQSQKAGKQDSNKIPVLDGNDMVSYYGPG